jgi:hypothetical protein
VSQFSGKQAKGAMTRRRELKRAEAEVRNKLTKPERRSNKRPGTKMLYELFSGPLDDRPLVSNPGEPRPVPSPDDI